MSRDRKAVVNAMLARQDVQSRLLAARAEAVHEAYKNLARYKFFLFGYYAARWVTLNKIVGDRSPNPFGSLVNAARIQLAGEPK